LSRLVIIGAGSTVFVKNLVGDLLLMDNLKLDTISLVDIDGKKLEIIKKLINKVKNQIGSSIKIEVTTDRRKVLAGADYVVSTIDVGGLNLYQRELEIADRYGVNQNVADTLGPGGVFKGLRIVPIIIDICRDIKELCPDAILFNYTNPMCIAMLSIFYATEIEAYGLCHSVQGTAYLLTKYLGVPIDKVSYLCAGINHMAWYLSYKVDGVDAYPRLKAIARDKRLIERLAEDNEYGGIKLHDDIRFSMLEHFGYFITESPFHLSEYLPYFRKNPDTIKKYKVETRWHLGLLEGKDDYFRQAREIVSEGKDIEIKKSYEYLPDIIHALETGIYFRANINVLNRGLIDNLPRNSCVEVPCLVGEDGIRPLKIGKLPEQCAALNRSNIGVQILAAKACLEPDEDKKKELVKMAIKLDPLTGAVLTLDKIDDMVEELFKLNRSYLIE
jgi:alpha-galactosidase